MAGGGQVPVLVAKSGATVVVKPQGPCTVAIWGTVCAGLKGCRSPAVADIGFDLSEAEGIDSTFAGFLCSLMTHGGQGGVPRVHLIHPSREVVQALTRMHVLPLFDVRDVADPQPAEWSQLPAVPLVTDGLTEVIVEAHQELINADSRNAAAYGPLVTTLKARLAPA